MKNKSPWKTNSSKIVFQNSWISLREDEVTTPSGKPGKYTYLEAKPFVIVVAIDNNELVMIKQYRYPVKKTLLEFPAGGFDHNEQPLDAAKRELKEETGYEATNWKYIGEFYELTSVSKQEGHLFLATWLKDTREHAMSEDGIEGVVKISVEELQRMIGAGEIIDALTPAVFCKIKSHLTDLAS